MRNQYPGRCYRCGGNVGAREGHFERIPLSAGQGAWRVQHADCAIEFRGTDGAATPELRAAIAAVNAARQAMKFRELTKRAAGTGKAAQRARKTLKGHVA